jgi:diadenosine tetraphosphatase ApaH/serine/threonine PP2A family protein phosphatase
LIALLSDIHGNLEALQAVLDDARGRDIASFYCLGDTVGFGPDPRLCVEIVESFDLCLAGYWDYFVTGNGEAESRRGKSELEFWYKWVRSELTTSQLEFLQSRPSINRRDGKTYAHGDPIDTVNGYLFPETIYDANKMRDIFAAFDGIFHCGHTHIGGVFTESSFVESGQFDGRFAPESESAIINVGSVGQPRDSDPRACYVVSCGDDYEFVRVPYDYEKTRRKLDDLDPPGLAR